jgi:hypothetical protein
MLIVPIGKVNIQLGTNQEAEEADYFENLFRELQRNCAVLIGRSVEGILEQELDQLLKRKRHQRRRRAEDRWEGRMKCRRCCSHQVRDFRRNGHYRRGDWKPPGAPRNPNAASRTPMWRECR